MNCDLMIRYAQLYAFLAGALLYPTENWMEDAPLVTPILSDLNLTEPALAQPAMTLSGLQAAHRHTFGLTGSLCYETEYGLPHEFRQSQEMADICGFYLALLLTWLRAPLVSSQGLTLVAAHVAGDLPLADPLDERWQAATALVVPLSAQMIARPVLPEARVKAVTVRALHNETQLALALEWADDTQNDQSVRVQDFRDGAAVQFPLAAGMPFYYMGQQGGDVNRRDAARLATRHGLLP